MKIHYNPIYEAYEVTECNNAKEITLDGVKLISVNKLRDAMVQKRNDCIDTRNSYTSKDAFQAEAMTWDKAIEMIDKEVK